MKLHIISSTQKYTVPVEWLEAETRNGSFIIKQGHAPLLLILAQNRPITFMNANGKQESIPVGQGILESNRKEITVIMRDMR